MDYHNLMEGRAVVAGAWHEALRWRLAMTSSAHTSVHRGCSLVQLVAQEWQRAAAVGGSHTGHRIQVEPHRLCSHGWLPGTGPSDAADTSVHMDPGRRSTAAELVLACSIALGPGAGHSLRCCCILQLPMDLLVRLERHCCDKLSFQPDLEEVPTALLT